MGNFVKESDYDGPRMTGGRFNLIVSFRYLNLEEGEFDFFRELFTQVSYALFRATYGQHFIGQVSFAFDYGASDIADIFIHPANSVFPNSTDARLWLPYSPMDMSQDLSMYVSLMVHELSHYLYNLRDEYVDAPGRSNTSLVNEEEDSDAEGSGGLDDEFSPEGGIGGGFFSGGGLGGETSSGGGLGEEISPGGGLGDEISGGLSGSEEAESTRTDSCCVNDLSQKACIMESYGMDKMTQWRSNTGEKFDDFIDFMTNYNAGNVQFYDQEYNGMQYCNSDNHRPENSLCSNKYPFPSCWEQILDPDNHGGIPYNFPLVFPPTGLRNRGIDSFSTQEGKSLNTFPAIEYIELVNENRVAIVVDTSDSINDRTFKNLQLSANLWIENIEKKQEFKLITSSDKKERTITLSSKYGKEEQPNWKNKKIKEVNEILQLNRGKQVRGLNERIKFGLKSLVSSAKATNQALIIILDKYESKQIEDISKVLPDLIAKDIRLYLLIFDNIENTQNLSEMANATGGGLIGLFRNKSISIPGIIHWLINETKENTAVVHLLNEKQLFPIYNFSGNPKNDKAIIPLPFTKESDYVNVKVLWDAKRHKHLAVQLVDEISGKSKETSQVSGEYGFEYKDFLVKKLGGSKWALHLEQADFRKEGIEVLVTETNRFVRTACNVLSNKIKEEGKLTLKISAHYKAFFLDNADVNVIFESPIGAKIEFKNLKPGAHTFDIPFEENGQYLIFISIDQREVTKKLRIDSFLKESLRTSKEEIKTVKIPRIHREKILFLWVSRTDEKKRFIHGYNIRNPEKKQY